jgi:hypothetical protein
MRNFVSGGGGSFGGGGGAASLAKGEWLPNIWMSTVLEKFTNTNRSVLDFVTRVLIKFFLLVFMQLVLFMLPFLPTLF